jgi:uncharacterized RDD family membrane protein YckC
MQTEIDQDYVDEDELNDSTPNPPSPPPSEPASAREIPEPTTSAWKSEVSARIRAHRNRTSRTPANQPALPGLEDAFSPASGAGAPDAPGVGGVGRIAARVAERYARVPSYSEMLAAQAAAAKSTVDSMVAAASASAALPAEPSLHQPSETPQESEAAPAEPAPEPSQPSLLRYSVSSDSLPAPRTTPAEARAEAAVHAKIPDSFQDPLEEALVEPAQPLPARIMTSPRELVAPRKARPRLAEGPLYDEAPRHAPPETQSETQTVAASEQPMPNSPAGGTQPRIPEVQPETAPPSLNPSAQAPPEWRSIHLDSEAPIREPKQTSSLLDGPRLHVASIEDRAIAALVDAALTLAAFLLFLLVFDLCTTSLPHGRIALIGAGVTLFAMWVLYQLLFFSLTNATPGMRYAKIALCTFSDENPNRSVLRGRIAALLLSALPLGLGFLWAAFDEDALGWHDRITQTYQRSYRQP